MSQTWDLDALTPDQKVFLGEGLAQTNDGSSFVPREDYLAQSDAINGLVKLGIVEVDGKDADEVFVAITDDARDWLLSLPEGSLDTSIGTSGR